MLHYKINKGFIVQKAGRKITIFDTESSVLYSFNETASFIFQKLKSKKREEEIVQLLVTYYKVKEEKAAEDVNQLLKQLIAQKIILSL